MPNTYTVYPTTVQLNGTPIANLVAFAAEFEYNTEGGTPHTFTGCTLAMRVADAPSTAARAAAIALAGAAYTTLLAPENAIRPTTREFRPVAGDTVVFTNIGSVTYQGQYALSSDDQGGTDQI